MTTDWTDRLAKQAIGTELGVLALAAIGSAAYQGSPKERGHFALGVALVGTALNWIAWSFSMRLIPQWQEDIASLRANPTAPPVTTPPTPLGGPIHNRFY